MGSVVSNKRAFLFSSVFSKRLNESVKHSIFLKFINSSGTLVSYIIYYIKKNTLFNPKFNVFKFVNFEIDDGIESISFPAKESVSNLSIQQSWAGNSVKQLKLRFKELKY